MVIEDREEEVDFAAEVVREAMFSRFAVTFDSVGELLRSTSSKATYSTTTEDAKSSENLFKIPKQACETSNGMRN